MLFIQTHMPGLLITPGRPSIISTWVTTPILPGGSGTVITVVSLLGSVTAIHRGITHTTIMATIRHGMPRIITTLIIPPGGHTEAIAHTAMPVATMIKRNITVTNTTVMPEMATMASATHQMKISVTIVLITSVARILPKVTIHL